jgi:hypothetical protein
MSELVLSAFQREMNHEKERYVTSTGELKKNALVGLLEYKIHAHKRTVVRVDGKESQRTFAKGERVRLVTRPKGFFSNILKAETHYDDIQCVHFSTQLQSPMDDHEQEFLVVDRGGEEMVLVDDVFPAAWGFARTSTTFPRTYWVEVTRLMLVDAYDVCPSEPTERTGSAYAVPEAEEKVTSDIQRQLYLVEQLGAESDRYFELEQRHLEAKSAYQKLKRAAEEDSRRLREEVARLREENERLVRSTANEVRRARTDVRKGALRAAVAAAGAEPARARPGPLGPGLGLMARGASELSSSSSSSAGAGASALTVSFARAHEASNAQYAANAVLDATASAKDGNPKPGKLRRVTPFKEA